MLEVVQVTKRFHGLVALSDVDLSVGPQEILGLIGPNGAGKTTLFNIITGIDSPTSGTVKLDNRTIAGLKPFQIAVLGIGRTFQKSMLFEKMTVLENVLVPRLYRLPKGVLTGAPFREPFARESREDIERVRSFLEMVGLRERDLEIAGNLPYGEQRLLEIARALALDAPYILLDEPAAGMNPEESQRIVDLIRRIRETGRTVLVIEHDMEVVMNVCDRVAVLDHGVKIADGPPQEVQKEERVIEAYLGRRRKHA